MLDNRRKRRNNKYVSLESEEQEALFQWAAIQSGNHPELKWLFHIPNGGFRHKATAAALKRQGVKPGVLDLCLPVPRKGFHGLYIELKRLGEKPSPRQNRWLLFLREQGYKAVVAVGWVEAAEILLDYLKNE